MDVFDHEPDRRPRALLASISIARRAVRNPTARMPIKRRDGPGESIHSCSRGNHRCRRNRSAAVSFIPLPPMTTCTR